MANATAMVEDVQGQNRGASVPAEAAWLTYWQAGLISGLGRTKLWQLVGAGEVTAAKVGSAVRIERTSLEEFMRRSSS